MPIVLKISMVLFTQIFLEQLTMLIKMNDLSLLNSGWGKSRFTIVSAQNTGFILVLLFINCCIFFHTNNCNLLCPSLYFRALPFVSFSWGGRGPSTPSVWLFKSQQQPSVIDTVIVLFQTWNLQPSEAPCSRSCPWQAGARGNQDKDTELTWRDVHQGQCRIIGSTQSAWSREFCDYTAAGTGRLHPSAACVVKHTPLLTYEMFSSVLLYLG